MVGKKGLFPAPAGVIPKKAIAEAEQAAVPRTRGGDPGDFLTKQLADYCSPHPRG